MQNNIEAGQSPEQQPKLDYLELVREFNKRISDLIRRAQSQEVITPEQVAEIESRFSELDEILSDLAFDSADISALYSNFQRILPGRIQRLRGMVATTPQPGQRQIANQETAKGAEALETKATFSLETGELTMDSAPIFKFSDPAKKKLFGQLVSLNKISSVEQFFDLIQERYRSNYTEEEQKQKRQLVLASEQAIEELDSDLIAALGANTFFRIEKKYQQTEIIPLTTAKIRLQFEYDTKYAVISGWDSQKQAVLTPSSARAFKYLLEQAGEWVSEDDLINLAQYFFVR